MSNGEPHLVTDPTFADVLTELVQRELIFHHPACGMTRADCERMTDATFWEIGASGRRYSRESALDVLEKREAQQAEDTWQTRDFHLLEIAADNYLLTYTLIQGARVTRRSTIWRRTDRAVAPSTGRRWPDRRGPPGRHTFPRRTTQAD